MSDYTRIQNDTGHPIKDLLKTDGTTEDVSGATVAFTMWNAETGNTKINENTTNVALATDGTDGRVNYNFDSGDLDTAGVFYFEWEVTYADGTIVTYRSDSGAPKELKVLEEGA